MSVARHHAERVTRVQVREMRNKWGSISTAGTLTLARDLLGLPRRLAEYVIVHELLHLRLPRHNRLFRLVFGAAGITGVTRPARSYGLWVTQDSKLWESSNWVQSKSARLRRMLWKKPVLI